MPAREFAASIPLIMALLISSKGLLTGGKITAILGRLFVETVLVARAVDVKAPVCWGMIKDSPAVAGVLTEVFG